MKKLFVTVICIILLSMQIMAFDFTGNIVKLPLLKSIIAKNSADAQPSTAILSESEIVPREGSVSLNRKHPDRYSAKQAFIVSDKDWHNVLSLVPVSLWYEGGELKKYPVLIYHEEYNGFDADSVITFIKQYNAKKVVLVGDTPEELDNILIADGYTTMIEVEAMAPSLSPITGRPIETIPGVTPIDTERYSAPIRGIDLTPNWLTRISPDDYTRYWSNYNTVVVCEDNYQLGLLASVYASYLNAPLFFEGRVPSDVSLARKRIITVGRTSYAGAESYNEEQLQRKLLEIYPTDKIILANYNDLSISETKPLLIPYRTILNYAEIQELYSKTSLSAPFLAVAKKEFILTTDNSEKNAVKAVMEGKIATYGLEPKYLTIMASPPAIQMDEKAAGRAYYSEIDNHFYGDLNVRGVVDGLQDLAVGRIFSLTPSDVSAYVARDIFIEYFRSDKNFASLWPIAFSSMKTDAKSADKVLSNAGFAKNSIYMDDAATPELDTERDINHKSYIAYLDHGFTSGWGAGIQTNDLRRLNIKMDPAIVFSVACLTCAYSFDADSTDEYAHPEGLFCANILKHGAIAHIGAVDETSADLNDNSIIVNELLQGKDIGHALLKYKHVFEAYRALVKESKALNPYESASINRLAYEPYQVLLGDPTIKLVSKPSATEEVSITEEDAAFTNKKIRINIEQPDETFTVSCNNGEGAEDCSTGEFTFYDVPVSRAYVGGTRQVSDRLNPAFNPIFEDMLYFETSGFDRITEAKLKINYADSRSEIFTLTKNGNMFYKCTGVCTQGADDLVVQLYDIKPEGTKHRIFMHFKKKGIGISKISPEYSYEIDLTTETATGTRRFD
ncbi:MAG: C25 family cysteine peptidase [Candidatus Nanoarchaeia archaeon]|nr:C25 family cysteine peptidase [Candidatus Nanoarchaeia archaeon]